MQTDLYEYDLISKQIKISEANSKKESLIGINDLNYDSTTNNLFISTYGQGIFAYNITNKNLFQYKQSGDRLPLSANYPKTLLKDKNGVIWIGYDGKGIDVLDPNLKKFIPTKKVSDLDEENLRFIWRILEDKNGIIWFASSGSGLIEYHRKTGQYVFYNKGSLKPEAENFVLELELVNDNIWLGLNGGGILIFNIPSRKVIKHIKPGPLNNQVGNSSIWSLYFDKEQQGVWGGTSENGIFYIDIYTYNIKKYYSKNNPLYEENGCSAIYKKPNGEIIIGSMKGLLRLNKKADIFERIYPNADTKLTVMHSIKCITVDNKGQYWLGSDGAGISILDSQLNLIRTISTEDNLSNNVVYGIQSENNYSYWASTNKGLCNINWSDDAIKSDSKLLIYNYEVASGLQSNEFNSRSYAKLKDGTLVFGGIGGVNFFQGKDVKPSKVIPKVVITAFSVFNRKINENKLITYINNLGLAYNQNSFSLSYNTVGFTIPDKVNYKYRLVGYDKEWIDANERTYVSYTNLDPGNYEFQVRASNYDGYWNKEYTSLKINISSPFYLRWWFILGFLLISTIVFWSIVRNKNLERTKREKLKIQYTKEIAEVEMKALRAQINPHFLFNSLNSINNFILKNENAKARKYLVKFSQLVRNILNNSTSPYVSLKEELDTINLYVQIESMRFDNQFRFDLKIEESLNINRINIPSLLLQPYIENAIWHGLLHKEGDKNIEIRINQSSEDTINIAIEDNGIGRIGSQKQTTRDSKRKSYGMQLGENRLKLMNSEHQSKGDVEVIDLFDENNFNNGTLIEITLPILESKKNIPT